MPWSVDGLDKWNRKLHIYVGLYLLLFTWLFAFTGLLLNHGQWKFAEFWANRKQSRAEYAIRVAEGKSDLQQAEEILRQTGIRGEIEWTKRRTSEAVLEFRAARPGTIHEIRAELGAGRAVVKRIEFNGWGVARTLHTFTGVRMRDARNARDWWATRVWAYSMDAVAAGLLFVALSGVWVWWRAGRRRAWGLAALGAGLASCGWLVFGLRWWT